MDRAGIASLRGAVRCTLLVCLTVASPVDAASVDGAAGLRRPSALALTDQGRHLWVGNAATGTISLIGTGELELLGEHPAGASITDLAAAPGGDRLLALDGSAHEMLVLSAATGDEGATRVVDRVALSPYPARLARSQDGEQLFVTALWSRRLDVVSFAGSGSPQVTRSVVLPFAPRELLVVGPHRVLVADAFGGRLQVVDTETGTLESGVELPIHNIGGLALSPDGSRVLVPHQSLSPYATTSREDVLWGFLVANRLLSLRLDAVLNGTVDPSRPDRTLDLGDFSTPAGDPGRVTATPQGEVVVALGGAARVALGKMEWPRLDHVRVGRRPGALAASEDGRLYVANTLGDSVSVVDVSTRKILGTVALRPAAKLTEAEKGERIFFDAGMSLRGWMSCHSCHTEGHANGLTVDTLGDGGFGAPKRVPSLLGVGQSGPWAWNGRVDELEHQVGKSLKTTLHGTDVTSDQIRALTSYLQTLQPPELPPEGDPEARRRGEDVFLTTRCDRCHTPPTYTSLRSRIVGLVDEVGNRRFNPPSLRGVRHRSSLLHDGRASSLEELFLVHEHPGVELSEAQVQDLIAFLSTL